MLRIYPVILELVRFVRPFIKELERYDPDLAAQCKRALCSVPLMLQKEATRVGATGGRVTTRLSVRFARCSHASKWVRRSVTFRK